MSDTLIAKGSESKFKAHDEGQYIGVCVDTIDLGQKVSDFPGETPYLVPVCALVYRTGEKNAELGTYIDVAREFTVSMSDRSNLRKYLEQWRGKAYTEEQIKAGVPLHRLTGNAGLLTIAHRKSGKGRVYANITACVGVPKQMLADVPQYDDYQREAYWETKKKEYAEAVAKFRGEQGTPSEVDSAPAADDDLPF